MRTSLMRSVTMALFALLACSPLMAESPFGADLLKSGSFETAGAGNVPDGWSYIAEPTTGGTCSLDASNPFAGKTSVRLEAKRIVYLRSRSVPLPPAAKGLLFAFAYRTQGFQTGGKSYSGVSASLALQFLDAKGTGVAPRDDIGLPYSDKPWTSFFRLISPLPKGATQVMVVASMSNDSENVSKQLLPAMLWLDSLQVLPYTPPDATAAPPKLVQEFRFGQGALMQANVGKLVADDQAAGGSAVTSITPETKGFLLDSPPYPSAGPGLYRATLRCKVTDAGKTAAAAVFRLGPVDGMYALDRSILPNMFASPAFADLNLDFVLLSNSKWSYQLEATGTQTLTVDKLTIQKLAAMRIAMPGASASEPPAKQK